MTDDVKLIHGDCLEVLRSLPDGSVDCVVTSPPYDKMRRYASGHRLCADTIATELLRVCGDGAVVVWVVNDQTLGGSETGSSFRQALTFMERGWRLHDTMIFAKQNPVPVNDKRYLPSFEYMFVFSKGAPATFSPLLEPCKMAGKISTGTMRHNLSTSSRRWNYGRAYGATKPRKNIWFYPIGVERVPEHPAVFPLALATDHIKTWTNEGDTVLDPFLGSGTTGVAAKTTGRKFIGIEIDKGYFDIASKRIEAAQRERSEQLIPA